jgi:KDO2-lipid IV(A) lauroyltransferase
VIEPHASDSRKTNGSSAAVADAAAIPLYSFWRPRFWLTWLFVLWLKLAASLPAAVSIRLHKRIGRLLGALLKKRRRIVVRNLELCFPERSPAEIGRLARGAFENIGACVGELAITWFGRPLHDVTFDIEGVEHLTAAVARGQGVLLYAGHFTPLEICAPAIKPLVPYFGFIFRARTNPLLNEIQRRGRTSTAHVSIENDDVRSLLKQLGKNAAVWYAPDQARIDNGELLPFFGEPAMMSTITSRLALRTGAAVVPLFFRREPSDDRYTIRFHPALDGFPTDDATADTLRLIAILEDFVRTAPDQYIWTTRRFKDRPGLPDPYR